MEADALSRIPLEWTTLNHNAVKAIIDIGCPGTQSYFEAYSSDPVLDNEISTDQVSEPVNTIICN